MYDLFVVNKTIHLRILLLIESYTLFLRTDKWAESELGTKWGDKWEEKFVAGIGSRQGETWHASLSSESRPYLVFSIVVNSCIVYFMHANLL